MSPPAHDAETAPMTPHAPPKVDIIVLNWNRWWLTDRALTALERLEYTDCRTIVVDNGSTDDSLEQLNERHPKVGVVSLHRNLGFAGGMNAGIRTALENGAEYVWLLNNDTEAAPGALTAMVAVADSDPTIGAVGSVLMPLSARKRPVYGGGVIGRWSGLSRHHLKPVANRKIDYIVGASMLLRSTALREVGLLDEAFFFYWEDVDLSFRLRKQGWTLAVADKAVVIHEEKGTLGDGSPEGDFHFTASAVRFFRTHSKLPGVPMLVGSSAWAFRHLSRGRPDRAMAVFRALWSETPFSARDSDVDRR